MDCSPPDSSVCGIFQTRILEWVAISFSRGFSQPRNWTLLHWQADSSPLNEQRSPSTRIYPLSNFRGPSLMFQMIKNLLQCRRPRFDPWVRKIPREGNDNPVFLPGEFHGQKTLVSYSPFGQKELDVTGWLILRVPLGPRLWSLILLSTAKHQHCLEGSYFHVSVQEKV